jgi:hypothetical protein
MTQYLMCLPYADTRYFRWRHVRIGRQIVLALRICRTLHIVCNTEEEL